ncbi:MAG: hypothetical protein QM773_04885 [Hyphomonadaceae bacterium]
MTDRAKAATRYAARLNEICVRLGFCGSSRDGKRLHVSSFIPETGVVSADQFAEWVVLAERMDPLTNRYLAEFKRVFINHMRAAEVDAEMLRF